MVIQEEPTEELRHQMEPAEESGRCTEAEQPLQDQNSDFHPSCSRSDEIFPFDALAEGGR